MVSITVEKIQKDNLHESDALHVILVSKQMLKKKARADNYKSKSSPLPAAVLDKLRRQGFKANHEDFVPVSLQAPQGGVVEYLIAAEPPETAETFERLQSWRKLGAHAAKTAKQIKLNKINLTFEMPEKLGLAALIEGARLGSYSFSRYKSWQADSENSRSANSGGKSQNLTLTVSTKSNLDSISKQAQVFAEATCMARDLINTPGQDCTPHHIAALSKEMAKTYKLSLRVNDRADLKKMSANLLLAVARGSANQPYLLELGYKPKRRAKKTIALVGKGITFDSGGLSIKTAAGMETMKVDMAGAAAVLGAVRIAAELELPVEVRAYIPTAENMVSSNSVRPGDVVIGMNGKSVEILNTDAEGRLILADALVHAQKRGCDSIVDVATLTGACAAALGPEYAGVFSEDDRLVARLIESGAIEGERLWRLPLAAEYREMIKSPIADLKNRGGQYAGAITAALFLKEFVTTRHWAHIDIAGTASSDSDRGHVRKGAVGFGVRTLGRFLMLA